MENRRAVSEYPLEVLTTIRDPHTGFIYSLKGKAFVIHDLTEVSNRVEFEWMSNINGHYYEVIEHGPNPH
jgi:hypothetical protein